MKKKEIICWIIFAVLCNKFVAEKRMVSLKWIQSFEYLYVYVCVWEKALHSKCLDENKILACRVSLHRTIIPFYLLNYRNGSSLVKVDFLILADNWAIIENC